MTASLPGQCSGVLATAPYFFFLALGSSFLPFLSLGSAFPLPVGAAAAPPPPPGRTMAGISGRMCGRRPGKSQNEDM
eukprot:CAMPEP_0196740280 /NCGR_PEP_ID=MMETSP1091-20130531/30983_1 /TAXON_ID=302021 /ORGANISM="Rhodomonas sp., Strain CCMP768" /LENGTH=76 /DNA_ID=CAMNT_0042085351 /DNA_START=44 /DNA_END=275 /DNA_ORIENTATION=+